MSTSTEHQFQSDAIAQLLPQDRAWWSVPNAQEKLERSEIIKRFDYIKQANLDVVGNIGAEADAIIEDHEQSVEFAHQAFDEFEADTVSDQTYDWAFIVPVRGEENQGNRYAPEVTDFLPILDPKRGVGAMALQRTVAHLAPTKIETYQGNASARGMIVFAPAYFDPRMLNDREFAAREGIPAARQRINEAARLVSQRYNVGLVGLGAVLPGITQLGKTIKEPGLVTTTGHGGTVHLISETVRYASSKQDQAPHVGIIGLGSIGFSSLEILQSDDIRHGIQKFHVYDVRPELIQKSLQTPHGSEIVPAESIAAVLEKTNIIVTAITDTVDLDVLEEQLGRPIDLQGKVIIDDSQPGCFQRDQVEARGGVLAWVVGSDQSYSKFLHREGGYQYGVESGLYGNGSSWGCEAEVGALAVLGRSEQAVNSHVTPEIARIIGASCFEAGIRVEYPLQSFGRPVEF